MIAVIMIVSIIAQVSQQMCRKEYNKRCADTPFGFSLIGVLATFIYFLVLSRGSIDLSPKIIPYAIPFALCYLTAYICTIFAIKHGPLSLTSLMISCSVVVPMIYGCSFLGESVSIALILGIVMLLLSITLVSEPWQKENSAITPKWVIYITLTFFSNGICLIIQKLFQMKDSGVHSIEFMICSLAIVFMAVAVFAAVFEKKSLKVIAEKGGIIWPVLCGAGNGVANRLTMLLAISLPASFLYPVQSAGAIILTAVVSVWIYKERMSLFQKIGFVFGVIAIVIFNL